ncbi:hypothetical protein [Streptomyces spinoverrucosus]|uniref:hypothetical protein n=1 Tax=Streptomyces spinoverrucosus TaxID=284043 RepID=UPI0011412D17|nr:hypothetical protein [Streptomyces spinoverrucosus]
MSRLRTVICRVRAGAWTVAILVPRRRDRPGPGAVRSRPGHPQRPAAPTPEPLVPDGQRRHHEPSAPRGTDMT